MLWITPLLVFKYYWFKKPDLVALMSLFESASWQAQPGEREGEMEEREREREVRDPAIPYCASDLQLMEAHQWRPEIKIWSSKGSHIQ